MRRFRVQFGKGEPLRYVSHLDLMRTWERALRRAGLKLAHTQGFNPRPRLVFAAPLPVGITSAAEIVDVIVEDDIDAEAFRASLGPVLPPGLSLTAVDECPLEAPAVMAMVFAADYEADVGESAPAGIAEAFLAQQHVPYGRKRKGKVKQSDMRPAVLDLWRTVTGHLGMRLRLDQEGLAVRPDEVLNALELQAVRIHRTALTLKTDVQNHKLTEPVPASS